MKRLFFATVLVLTLSASAFATNETKNPKIISKVAEQFEGASNVEVLMKKNYMQVLFTQNDEKVQAFYQLSGDFIGSSRNIDISNLPTNAKRTFAKKYVGFTVTEAILFEGAEETAYYISAQKDGVSVVLKVSEAGMMNVFKKLK